MSNHLELIELNPKDEPDKQRKDAEFASTVFGVDIDLVGGCEQNESFMGLTDAEHCGKMRAVEKLMFSWVWKGGKILLFSYSVRMLDILEKFLIHKGYCFSRLDGSTPSGLRQSLVDDFNSSPIKQISSTLGLGAKERMKWACLKKTALHSHVSPLWGGNQMRVVGMEMLLLQSNPGKRANISLLAQFLNMGEVDFSKWLMSPTPAERERVLRDFKRKEKVPDG